MRAKPARPTASEIRTRPGQAGDIPALDALERGSFATDRLSRRGLRRFLTSQSAALIVAELDGRPAGYALVLLRNGSSVARLYSIAVAARLRKRGIGTRLIAAAEEAAIAHGASVLRLEVRARNARAIRRYRKAGFREFGHYPAYYQDEADALRFEKPLTGKSVLVDAALRSR